MTLIPAVNGALGTILSGLGNGEEVLEIRGQVETRIKKSPGDLRGLEGTCCHSNTC